MNALTLKSPAKINLYLRVAGKLPGGYHQLVTLFHRISLCDEIQIKKTKGCFSLQCSDKSLPTGEDNLITRAYRLLQSEFPSLGGVNVRLLKNIPLQSGLGGGSSNAAFFLLGMIQLFGLSLPFNRLLEIGRRLGADVPFFLYDVNQAWGFDRGDRIRIYRAKRKASFVLILSNKGLSTKEVFQKWSSMASGGSLTKTKQADRIPCLFSDRESGFELAAKLHNDLELPAFTMNTAIRERMALLVQMGASASAMSGSGPTVFSVVNGKKEAENLTHRLKKYLSLDSVRICRTF